VCTNCHQILLIIEEGLPAENDYKFHSQANKTDKTPNIERHALLLELFGVLSER